MSNQCMGCQAGWPTRVNQFGGHLIHEVQGGYPHEIVSCTRERYEEIQAREPGKPDRRTDGGGTYSRDLVRRLYDRVKLRLKK